LILFAATVVTLQGVHNLMLITRWITRQLSTETPKGRSTIHMEASVVNRDINKDIARLPTSDLVLCWTILAREREWARQSGHGAMADEFYARLRALDAEIQRRQLDLFGELAVDPDQPTPEAPTDE